MLTDQRNQGPEEDEADGEAVDSLHETLQCPGAHCLPVWLGLTFIPRGATASQVEAPPGLEPHGVWRTIKFMVFSPRHRYQEVNSFTLQSPPSTYDKGWLHS